MVHVWSRLSSLLIDVDRDKGEEKDQHRWEDEQKTWADWGVGGGGEMIGRNAANSEVMWQERCVT